MNQSLVAFLGMDSLRRINIKMPKRIISNVFFV